jgi:hypothetical protein
MNNLDNKNKAGKTTGFALSLVAAAALAGAPAVAQAQSGTMQPAGWTTAVTLYGWFPSFGGESQYPTVGNPINVDADTIIDNLKFVFMGSLDVHNGRWGAFTDLIYMDVGGGKQNSRDFTVGGAGVPVGITADVNLDIKAWVWTLAGEYRVVSSPASTMDVLVGARMLDLKETLNYSLFGNVGNVNIPSRGRDLEVNQTNWDAIVGVKGRFAFGEKREWFVPYYLDIGTGESDLTWQGMIGLGYAFKWGDVVAAYRYLDYNLDTKNIKDFNAGGPMIGVTFRW